MQLTIAMLMQDVPIQLETIHASVLMAMKAMESTVKVCHLVPHKESYIQSKINEFVCRYK